jgi:hypothetical protein
MNKLESNPHDFSKHHKWRQNYYLNENYIGFWCELCKKFHADKLKKCMKSLNKIDYSDSNLKKFILVKYFFFARQTSDHVVS